AGAGRGEPDGRGCVFGHRPLRTHVRKWRGGHDRVCVDGAPLYRATGAGAARRRAAGAGPVALDKSQRSLNGWAATLGEVVAWIPDAQMAGRGGRLKMRIGAD